MLENLHWLGHASFMWDGAKVIYFDPWKLSAHSQKADLVLITHEHFDHYSLEDLKLISSENTIILTDKSTGSQLRGAGINCKEIKSLLPGESLEISDIKISAVESYNINKTYHTKDSAKLGFIVTVDLRRVYHAGDTDFIPEMDDFKCDIALLPVGGEYTMDAEEAVRAALVIKPKVAIPMHYGDIVGTEKDAKKFQDLLKGKIEVRILKKEA